MQIFANATPDDVFKSMGNSLDAAVNPNHIALIIIGIIGLLLLISFLSRRTGIKPARVPKPVNNPAKLMRQIAKQVGLSSKELRQLKQLAEQEKIENPVVLLLCPSILQNAMNKRKWSQK